MQAVGIAGEAIAIDARLSDYYQGATKRASLEKWVTLAEANDELLQRTRLAVADFSRTQDGFTLIQTLSEIKERLAAL